VGDKERSGPRKTEKKMNKIPNTGTAEIQRSANERERALKNLDSIEEKW